MVDAATLVRASFEAYLQAAFIAHDPESRQQLGRDYLDFEHIERYELVTRILKHDTYIAERLRSSPCRPEGQKRAKKQYEKVRQRYLTRKGDRLRDRWYSGDLRSVARAVGVESEYDLLVYAFHPYVHSSAYGVRLGPPVEPQYVETLASIIAARTAKVALDYLGMRLDGPNQTVLDTLAEGSMGGPPTKPTCDDGAAGPAD
jgi:hypothetical protein